METLERIQTRHRAILNVFDQVITELKPIQYPSGPKNDVITFIDPYNVERLANKEDSISNDYCQAMVVTEKTSGLTWTDLHFKDILFNLKIEGENFGYI